MFYWEDLPQSIITLHLISNLTSGLGFFGVSFFFNMFVHRVKLNVTNINKTEDERKAWISVNKYNYIFSLISAVFLFCGLGHIVEAFAPWSPHVYHMEIVHACTAMLGLFLVTALGHRFLVEDPTKIIQPDDE